MKMNRSKILAIMAVAMALQQLAVTAFTAQESNKARWGTLKPNLYFAVKEKAKEQSVLGLAWMVKDWRTDQLIVRHAYQYGNIAENVQAYYTAHDGENFARETIIDSEYNARFLVDFL